MIHAVLQVVGHQICVDDGAHSNGFGNWLFTCADISMAYNIMQMQVMQLQLQAGTPNVSVL